MWNHYNIPLLGNVIQDLKYWLPETTMTTFKLRLLMPNDLVEHKSWVQRRSQIFYKELFAASSLHWKDPGYHFRRGTQTLVWATVKNKVRC